MVTSRAFWYGAPLVIEEIVRRKHYLSVFDESTLPSYRRLLDCDVFIDMSAISRKSFYRTLEREYQRRGSSPSTAPLMVDPPRGVIDSLDKRRTHRIFPDLVPESYNLTGSRNEETIARFAADEFVVVKPAQGWWGRDVERLNPVQALRKHKMSKGLIVQRYIPPTEGVGRIVTLNHESDFEIACSYLRVSDSWRTGVDVDYRCVDHPVTERLYEFAHTVSRRSGLYLNGIDYLRHNGEYVLLEVNAVPAIREPYEQLGVDIAKILIDHIERNAKKRKV